MANSSLKEQIKAKISRCRKRNVFVREDFADLRGYDQVGRALLALTREGAVLRIGYGLYAKARPNRITGKPMLASEGGFEQVAKEALNVLGVKWQPSSSEKNYNAGETQIPVNTEVSISGRFNRQIGTDKFKLRVTH